LRKALLSGVNLVDTSSNYADGGSEALVGEVVGELVESGELKRESVVMASKVGYLQGSNYRLSQKRKEEGRPFPDLVLYGEGLEHCIHPEFIEDQLTRSLQRLQMDALDFYLLHNPEYYLGWARKQGLPVGHARREYESRLLKAFSHLEIEVDRGRIGAYGVSSNTFPHRADDYEFTSLEKLWELARSISPDHRFRLVQFPFNLLETGAITEKNQSGGRSVLDFAREKGLGALVNRPLNAILGNRLLRLADVSPPAALPSMEALGERLEAAVASEEHFKSHLLAQLNLPAHARQQVAEGVSSASLLRDHWREMRTYERWGELRDHFFVPRTRTMVQSFHQYAGLPPEIRRWLETYVGELEDALGGVEAFYRREAAGVAVRLKDWTASLDPCWGEAPTLSQKAVRALRSTRGVSTVLVGMRRESYVDDILEELARPVEVADRAGSWEAAWKQPPEGL